VLCPDGPKQFRSTVVKEYKTRPKIGTRIKVFWPLDGKFYNGKIIEFDSTNNISTIKYIDGDIEKLDLRNEKWEYVTSVESPTIFLTCTPSEAIDAHDDVHAFLQEIKALTGKTKTIIGKEFKRSREKEILGLIEKDVFEPVPRAQAIGHRIFGSRFVDTVKNKGTKNAYEKSRLVVQGFNDQGHGLLTHAPTVQRSSQRLLFALSTIIPNWSIYLRDVVQAYTQSTTELNRKIFVKPVPEFGYSNDTILRVHRPLYGVPEAGLHWFQTYHGFHTKSLSMTASAHDMCLLYTENATSRDKAKEPAALTCLQTDDSLILCNDAFAKLESKMSSRFECKAISKLAEGVPLKFNGTVATKNGKYIALRADVSSRNVLNTIDVSPVKKDQYVSQRARGAYISSVCRPDLVFGFASAAQFTNPNCSNARTLNKNIKKCIDTSELGLNYVSLDPSSISFGIFIDAAFANNTDYSSQLGFVTVLMDSSGTANIVHYGSIKSKRVTRSALAAELYGMVYGFDQSFVILRAIEQFLGREIKLQIFTDSLSLFDSLTNLNTTTEKRLLIDLSMLRESYEKREIADVFWIGGDENPADGLTKKTPCKALEDLMITNKLNITPSAWIERKPPPWAKPNSN